MKQILWSCAGLLLALLALLGGFRLFYDFEYHKIRPLCGEWRSTLMIPGSKLTTRTMAFGFASIATTRGRVVNPLRGTR